MPSSPERQFVAITDATDASEVGHVPFVQRHMESDFITIDPVPHTLSGELSYIIINDRQVCILGDRALNNVAGVWLRRPSPMSFELLKGVDEIYRRYSFDLMHQHTLQTYSQFDKALWISDYHATEKAELKTHQLAVANRLGFNVPDTLFTSNSVEAENFVRSHEATIVKPYTGRYPEVEDDALLFFSTKVTPETFDYQNLNLSPLILQEAIDAMYDLRITVVGDKVFTAAINADFEDQARTAVRDWRLGQYTGELKIEAADDLPGNIEELCILLVKELGLQFGAIDMIRDTKGKFWFLEINPNGQWAFVEETTGQQIGKAMARLLLSAPTKSD